MNKMCTIGNDSLDNLEKRVNQYTKRRQYREGIFSDIASS